MKFRVGLTILAALVTAGCSHFSHFHLANSIPKPKHGSVSYAAVDAKQRFVFVTKKREFDGEEKTIYCAEPSPDALSAISAALGGGLTVSDKAHGQIAGAFNDAAAQLGQRTTTIQLLRDSLYRACEAYANGAIDEFAYAQTLNNFDRVMITLLAIESLIGPEPASPVKVNAEAVDLEKFGKSVEAFGKSLQKAAEEEGEEGDNKNGTGDTPDTPDDPSNGDTPQEPAPDPKDSNTTALQPTSSFGIPRLIFASANEQGGENGKKPEQKDANNDAKKPTPDPMVNQPADDMPAKPPKEDRAALAEAVRGHLFKLLGQMERKPRLVASCMAHFSLMEKREMAHRSERDHFLRPAKNWGDGYYTKLMDDYCNEALNTYRKAVATGLAIARDKAKSKRSNRHPCLRLTVVEEALLKTESDCKAIQKKLCREADANFGEKTRRAIERWQKHEGRRNPDGFLRHPADIDKIMAYDERDCAAYR